MRWVNRFEMGCLVSSGRDLSTFSAPCSPGVYDADRPFWPRLLRSSLNSAPLVGWKALLFRSLSQLTRWLPALPASLSWMCFLSTVTGKGLTVPLLLLPLPPGSQASPVPHSVSPLEPYFLLTHLCPRGSQDSESQEEPSMVP